VSSTIAAKVVNRLSERTKALTALILFGDVDGLPLTTVGHV
jgi:hypothetical protein